MIGVLVALAGLFAEAVPDDVACTCTAAVKALETEGARRSTLSARWLTCAAVAIEARRQGAEPVEVVALAWHESRLAWPRSRRGAVGPLQVIPRWWCPGRRARGCDLIAAGVRAFVHYRRRVPRLDLAVCHYNAGNVCEPAARRYGAAVARRAARWGACRRSTLAVTR